MTAGNTSKLKALQRALDYQFRDPALLQQSLTHKSYGTPHNERLEFLGDAVLGYWVADFLHTHFSDQGEDRLTLVRAAVVKKSALARIAAGIDLGSYLRLGTGEKQSGGHSRASILADALEAVIGALHCDGGMAAVDPVLTRFWEAEITALQGVDLRDAKTRLQEWLQAAGRPLPRYTVLGETGAQHERRYCVECRLTDGDIAASATASSRRGAEKAAAEAVVEMLEDNTEFAR